MVLANCPEWIMSMEACNAHGIYCVPLYDTLGAGAMEFILRHAEVEIAFAELKKIGELLKTLPAVTEFLKCEKKLRKVIIQTSGRKQVAIGVDMHLQLPELVLQFSTSMHPLINCRIKLFYS